MTRRPLAELSRRDAMKLAGGAGVLEIGAVAGTRLLAGEDALTAGGADNVLETVRGRIQAAQDDLETENHDADVTAVTARRLQQAERWTSQALDTEKVN